MEKTPLSDLMRSRVCIPLTRATADFLMYCFPMTCTTTDPLFKYSTSCKRREMNYALMHQSQIPLLLQDRRNEILSLYLSGSWVKLEQFIGVEIRIGCQRNFGSCSIFFVQVDLVFTLHIRVFIWQTPVINQRK